MNREKRKRLKLLKLEMKVCITTNSVEINYEHNEKKNTTSEMHL